MTLPEVLLWKEFKGHRGDVVFLRQHPIKPYIVDFYCRKARLAVEVDGEGHLHPDQQAHDARRTAFLRRLGIRVVRLTAKEVLVDPWRTAEAMRELTRVRPRAVLDDARLCVSHRLG